jgi:hypothetical protein
LGWVQRLPLTSTGSDRFIIFEQPSDLSYMLMSASGSA